MCFSISVLPRNFALQFMHSTLNMNHYKVHNATFHWQFLDEHCRLSTNYRLLQIINCKLCTRNFKLQLKTLCCSVNKYSHIIEAFTLTLYSLSSALCAVHYTLHISHLTENITQCILHTAHCTLYTKNWP